MRPDAEQAVSATPAADDPPPARPVSARPVPAAFWLDRLFLLRPMLLAPVWAAFALGTRAARVERDAGGALLGAAAVELRWLPSLHEALSAGCLSLVVSALYVVNQMVDREVDAANRKLFILPLGLVGPRAAGLQSLLLLALAAALAGWRLAPAERALLALAAAVGWVYSVPPLRLKARAGWDVAANAAGYGTVSFLLGWRASGSALDPAAAARSVPLAFAAGALFLLSTLEDREGDRRAGLSTSGVTLGERGTRRWTLLLAAAALASALALGDAPVLLWGALAVPLYVRLLRRGGLARGFSLNQVCGRWLVLLAVPGCAALLPLLLLAHAGARAYYRRRFAFPYPRSELATGPRAR